MEKTVFFFEKKKKKKKKKKGIFLKKNIFGMFMSKASRSPLARELGLDARGVLARNVIARSEASCNSGRHPGHRGDAL
jgi:hypothetical protein